MKHVDLGEPTSFPDHVYLGCPQREYTSNESVGDENRKMFESRISGGASEKVLESEKNGANVIVWSCDVRRNVWKDIESWRIKQLSNCIRSPPCLDDHHFKKEEWETVGELSNVCSQIVLKCLYLTRIGGPDILWSLNNLARAVPGKVVHK